MLRAIYDKPVDVVPPLGPNPFTSGDVDARLAIKNSPSRWQNSALTGEVEFAYSQNGGLYTLGAGEGQFTLAVGNGGARKVYVYRDGRTSHVAAIEKVASKVELLGDVAEFDTSNRVVHVEPGDAVALRNQDGYWALVTVVDVFERPALNRERVIRFNYMIRTDRTTDFAVDK